MNVGNVLKIFRAVGEIKPQKGETGIIKLPDGSLEVKLTNIGNGLDMITIDGSNLPSLRIMKKPEGYQAPEGTRYIIYLSNAKVDANQEEIHGVKIYVGDNGLVNREPDTP